MTYEQRLKLLEITHESSLEDLKSSYRRLAKKYHPDLNRGLDGKMFHLLTESYEWLLQNHKPIPPKRSIVGYEKFFRIIPNGIREYPIFLPVKNVLECPLVIFCMHEYREFRVFLEKDDTLPKTIDILNLHKPLRLNINITTVY